jgi:UDPglucose 6-dehydrogenase
MDQRIGEKFLQAGIGYGGSCFPKDVRALMSMAEMSGYPFQILHAVEQVNRKQHLLLIDKAKQQIGDLTGQRIALLGLAFKPNTDDMREAPSVAIADALVRQGAQIVAYDPVAMCKAEHVLPPQVVFAPTAAFALEAADAAFVLTEWDEFKQPEFTKLFQLMKKPIVFDGRNCLDEASVTNAGLEYFPIGRAPRYHSQEKNAIAGSN